MASPVAQKYCWLNPPSCWWIEKDRKGTSQRTSSMPRVLRQEFPKHPEIHINSHYTVYPHCTTIFPKLSHVESCEIMSNHHKCAAKEKTFAFVWKWGTWNAIFYLLSFFIPMKIAVYGYTHPFQTKGASSSSSSSSAAAFSRRITSASCPVASVAVASNSSSEGSMPSERQQLPMKPRSNEGSERTWS